MRQSIYLPMREEMPGLIGERRRDRKRLKATAAEAHHYEASETHTTATQRDRQLPFGPKSLLSNTISTATNSC